MNEEQKPVEPEVGKEPELIRIVRIGLLGDGSLRVELEPQEMLKTDLIGILTLLLNRIAK